MELTQDEQYAAVIHDTILTMFEEGHENYCYDIEKLDATAFFTGYVLALGVLFSTLANEEIDVVEVIHKANQLVIQYLLAKAEDDKRGGVASVNE